MAKYFLRTKAPSIANKYYHDNSYNPYATPSYCMPNCTCYAFGRFSEVMGKRASLPNKNAGKWWSAIGNTYSRSQQPQVGAVICWSIPGKAGHVAIVERVDKNSNGTVKSILCSQSSYGKDHDGMYFGTSVLTPPSYTNWLGSAAVFQGFILNPAVASGTCHMLADSPSTATSPIYPVTTTDGNTAGGEQVLGAGDAFLYIAKSKADDPKAHAWVQEMIPSIGNAAWCAAYVSACAKAATINGKAIGIANTCSGIKSGTEALGGQSVDGPRRGNTTFIPKAGDLALFYWGSSTNTYDHIGIVTGYTTNPLKLSTVEGNTSGGCHYCYYTMNGSSVYSNLKSVVTYVRPNWNAVGGIMVDVGSASMMDDYGFVARLYDKINTKEDAIIREVGYVGRDMKPSISSSNIRLSLINHTLVYSGLMLAMGTPGSFQSYLQTAINVQDPTYDSGVTFVEDNLAPVPKAIYDFLKNHGCNSGSVIAGILANIQVASGYQTAAKSDLTDEKYLSCGIFLWYQSKDRMIEKVPDWETNLTGQLEFFWEQVTSWEEYLPIRNMITSLRSESARGAKQCAEFFLLNFEKHPDASTNIGKIHEAAFDIYDKLIKITTRPIVSPRTQTDEVK